MAERLIGLLIGTEEDWPRAFESLGLKPQKVLVTVFEHMDFTVWWRNRRALDQASM